MAKKIVRKVIMNKRNKQLSVTISKKQLKATNIDLKFGENLFVQLEFLKEKKKRR